MMDDKFQDKYRIASTRLQNWDYSWAAAYFITIVTKDRKPYFGNITDGKMVLSNVGILADVFLYEIKNHARNTKLGEFVVMPNHIHLVLILNGDNNPENDAVVYVVVETWHALSLQQQQQSKHDKTIGQTRFQNQGKNTVSSIIGSYKSAVTKHANRLGYEFGWQTRFYDHIIRDDKSFKRIANYIISNSINWNEDKFYNE
jgi:putative transposase